MARTVETCDPERRAALLAAAHAGTPTVTCFDPLRRPFLTIADNGPAGQHLTRVALDIEGNQRRITDPPDVETAQRFDMRGRRIHVESPDAGERLTLLDAAGKPVRAWDARGIAVHTVYVARQRGTHIFVRMPSLPAEQLAVQRVYGETHPEAEACTQTGNTSKDAAILRANMNRGGVQLKPGDYAHHIVPSTHPQADRTRRILDKFGIDINSAENGIALSSNAHYGRGLHSHAAIRQINGMLANAQSHQDVLAALRLLAQKIRAGSFP